MKRNKKKRKKEKWGKKRTKIKSEKIKIKIHVNTQSNTVWCSVFDVEYLVFAARAIKENENTEINSHIKHNWIDERAIDDRKKTQKVEMKIDWDRMYEIYVYTQLDWLVNTNIQIQTQITRANFIERYHLYSFS